MLLRKQPYWKNVSQQCKKSWYNEAKKQECSVRFSFSFCKNVTYPSKTTTFSSSILEISLECFHARIVTFYSFQNVLSMVTSERNTIVKKHFPRNFPKVASARFPSRSHATFCAVGGTNSNPAVFVAFFLVPCILVSSKHLLTFRSSITTIYPFPLQMLISPIN